MIKLDKVSKKFNKKLFNHFSYEFNKGKIYSIIGTSGCGKSTLLSMIANKTKIYSGNIYYNDIDIRSIKNYTFENVGYVYQDYQLFDNLTGLENILLYFKIKKINYDHHLYKINTLAKHFNVYKVINQQVKYMSGGEKQRIAIIKALIKDPEILLFDEPSSALDSYTSKLLIDYLHTIKKDKVIIIVTHDLTLANKCDEVIDFDNLKSKEVKVIKRKVIEKKIRFNNLSTFYNKTLSSKKIFSYITTAILSFGLISISLSFVIKDFVNQIVKTSFSTFNTNEYVTFKVKEEKTIIDFKNEVFEDIDYIYYEGIASDQKNKIKESSIIDSVYLNDASIDNTSFVFDNYLSSHTENFVLYVPIIDNKNIKDTNVLTIAYSSKFINIRIDKICQSTDNNYYIYCNNISYLYRYFADNNITYDLYKYYYSNQSNKLYDMLINSHKYKDYLFYHYYENNVIQIVDNLYSRITKDIIDIDYLYCDFIHTYIDYNSGLIYLLDGSDTLIVIDDSLKSNQVGVSLNYKNNKDVINIFDKNYKIAYISKESNYKIIYMSSFSFNQFNDSNNAFVGIVKKEDIDLLNKNNLIINEDLFDSNDINSFDYISKFLLFFSILLIILAFLSTITIININFISKKKDVKLLSNIGIYDSSIIKLLLKEPLSNTVYCSLYGAFFLIFSSFLVSFIYDQLANVKLEVNVSIYLFLSILLIPVLIIFIITLIKIKMFLRNNIKK